MTALSDILARVQTALGDAQSTRFPADLLQETVRQALSEISQLSPHMVDVTLTITTSGRNQPLTGFSNLLFLVKLTNAEGEELEPEAQFSYSLQQVQPVLHFTGSRVPQAGEQFTATGAEAHTLSGLDGSTSTSLPDALSTALVSGAAGHACLLRAGALAETYGGRSQETAALVEASRMHLELFRRQVEGVRILQEFGFPPGFALDRWDGHEENP